MAQKRSYNERLQDERLRIDKMTEMLRRSEYSPIVWEEWVDATLDLFEALIKDSSGDTTEKTLDETFNDDGIAPALVQHFRVRAHLRSTSL